ncbi:MAG: flavin reductase [Bilifractor sp.]
MDEKVLFNLSYGLFILTAKDGEKDNGCIINTVTQVTNTPNRMVIAVNKANYTHDMILKTGEFNISILSEHAKFDTFKHYGFQSGKNVDKFAEIEFRRSKNGIAYIDTDDTNGFISGKVIQTMDLGTHTLFLADVTDGEILSKVPSATYTYYFANIKPKPEVKPEEKKKGWICTICGYIYEGDELPADFICPICKHPASDFKRL